MEINFVIKKIYFTLALSSALIANPLLQAEESPASEYDPVAIPLADIQWGPPGGGNGAPVGVQTARQGTDSATGGITYYAKFPAGSHFDTHWHTHDEFVVVVQGTVTIVLGEESHSVSTGSYIVIPGKLNHSWDVPEGTEDAVIVVRRAGPADFHFVDR
ncbi:MAG: mannose-6-phosphate isomerase-like protein (cupin superfamily) [Kiritimatiellia bacterium]